VMRRSSKGKTNRGVSYSFEEEPECICLVGSRKPNIDLDLLCHRLAVDPKAKSVL